MPTSALTDYSYEVFICHSPWDAPVADEICAALRKAGINFLRQPSGDNSLEMNGELVRGISSSRVFLLLASENAYESKMVKSEITYAFNELPRSNIIPYVIDGSEMPLSFRFIFSSVNWRDRRTLPIEPALVRDLCEVLGRTVPTNLSDVDFGATSCFTLGTGHAAQIHALAINKSADTIASGADDGSVCLWDVFMGERKGEPIQLFNSEIKTLCLSPDSSLLAASSYNQVKLLDIASQECIAELKGSLAAISPDGALLAVCVGDSVEVYRLGTMELFRTVDIPSTFKNILSSICFSPEGSFIAVGNMIGQVFIIEVKTGEIMKPDEGKSYTAYLGKSTTVFSLSYSPDGRKLFMASVLGITVCNKRGREIKMIPTKDLVESVSASPDGRFCASADYVGSMKIYNTYTEAVVFEQRRADVNSVVFSPDGEFAVTGDCFGSVAIWMFNKAD